MYEDYKPWDSPPPFPQLSRDEVHVWRVSLDQPRVKLSALEKILSKDEIKRSQQFYFEQDRMRYIISRGSLRKILGLYLDRASESLQFHTDRQGKPFLTDNRQSIQFNVSHSGDVTLIAISMHRRVGVDIERAREGIRMDEITEIFFSIPEKKYLQALPKKERFRLFFTIWTRKEAVIKALGGNIAGLKDFAVLNDTVNEGMLIDVPDTENSAWILWDLKPSPGYSGAVCLEGRKCKLSCWHMA